MQESHEKRVLAVVLLRTIAGALLIYGAVQVIIGVIGPAAGAPEATPFRTYGVLHGLSGIVVWLLARPAARLITRGLE